MLYRKYAEGKLGQLCCGVQVPSWPGLSVFFCVSSLPKACSHGDPGRERGAMLPMAISS